MPNPIVNPPDEGSPSDVTEPVSDIPDEFQGKSQKELVDMYRHLERKLGEQSEELGSLRQLADQSIMSGSSKGQQDEDVDFYSDPEKAVERLLERKLAPFQQVLNKQQEQAVVQRLDAEHPGWKDTVKTENFLEWVSKSKVRTKLFVDANAADYTAADELLSTWAGLQASSSEKEHASKKAVEKDRKLRAVTTEKGSGGIDPRKILRRSDLQELKQKNPERYKQLMPDILKAYAEKRVR